MKYATYHRYFRKNSNFSFRKPRSDICDFCSKCEILLKEDLEHSLKTEFKVHRKKIDAYKSLKESIIKKAREDESVMALEFDYGQNLPLPKLAVTRQFYKRLLWMNVFNIHVTNVVHFIGSPKTKQKKIQIQFVHLFTISYQENLILIKPKKYICSQILLVVRTKTKSCLDFAVGYQKLLTFRLNKFFL